LLAWLLVTIASSATFRGSCWAFSATVAFLGHKYPPYVTPTGSTVCFTDSLAAQATYSLRNALEQSHSWKDDSVSKILILAICM